MAVACKATHPAPGDSEATRPVPGDSAAVAAIFRDTAVVSAPFEGAQTFELRTPGQREALRATLRKERELWRAKRPREYQFLLRVDCFCPGRLGWLLIEA